MRHSCVSALFLFLVETEALNDVLINQRSSAEGERDADGHQRPSNIQEAENDSRHLRRDTSVTICMRRRNIKGANTAVDMFVESKFELSAQASAVLATPSAGATSK